MNRQSGLSMLEVMVAIMMMTVGILAYIAAQDYNIRGRGSSLRMTTAVSLAQSEIETLCAQARELSAGNSTNATTQTVSSGDIKFTVASLITGDTAGGVNNLVLDGKSVWQAKTQVSWGFMGIHSVRMERLVLGQ